MKKILLKILRQDHPEKDSYWEEFSVTARSGMTVISALNEIRKNPVNTRGESTTPVVWESHCLGGMCGSCAMVVNGRVGLACEMLADDLGSPIRLEPLSKFPVLRDLLVDRTRMFQGFDEAENRIPFSGFQGEGGRRFLQEDDRLLALSLSSCIACGACLEACPQYNQRSAFMGAASIAKAHLAHLYSDGSRAKFPRLKRLMGEGGLDDCGNAQNCQKVCPVNVPLVSSIAAMNRAATKFFFRKLLG